MPSFLPTNDADLLLWAENFVAVATPTPANYGLTAPLVAALEEDTARFANDLAACAPAVRSKTAVVTKNATRAVLVEQIRLLVSLVNGAKSVTDAQKTQLGLHVRKKQSPSPVMEEAPVVEVTGVSGWTVKVRLRDAQGSHRRKPTGAEGASVFSFVGPQAPTDAEGWVFQGVTGKTTFDMTMDSSLPAGTKVWVTAFWFNGRKESGPAAVPVSTNLQGGSVVIGESRSMSIAA